MKRMSKFLESSFFVPLLVIVLGIIRWGLRAYGIGPKDTSMDLVLIAFFLLVSAVLWILDRSFKARTEAKPEGVKNREGEKHGLVNDK